MTIIYKNHSMNPYGFSYFDCVLGTIYIINTPKGISAIIFGKSRFKEFIKSLTEVRPIRGGEVEKSIREVRLYIGGRLKEFQVKLDLSSGTPFQISVWRELLKIPYGQVRTYGEIARRIGNPNAARAVGGAIGANPIPIIVPCHRVVATNGLGGYSSGIKIKKKLLHIERVLS